MTTPFETKTCSRCGGSGSYSYNPLNGSTCFGCGGSGRVLSKRGAAARLWLIARQERRADAVAVGDLVWYDPRPMGGKIGWHTVVAIRPQTTGDLALDLARGGVVRVTYLHSPESIVRWARDAAATGADVEAAVAYQSTLTQAGLPARRAAAAA